MNMTNVKPVKTEQVTSDIKVNWQRIQCHPHNFILFFHSFGNMRKAIFFLLPSKMTVHSR